MAKKTFLLALCVSAITVSLPAETVWVIRFRTGFVYSGPLCYRVQWLDELLFHNSTPDQKVINLVATTPGAIQGNGTLSVPSGRTASTDASAAFDFGGAPLGSGITVNQLDVPDGVTVASRAGVFGPNLPTSPCDTTPSSNNFNFGSLPLPVFRQLVPANQSQIHLGADLGVSTRRTNVILYNGGTAAATATVEYRVACDERLVESRTVVLQPNTVTQLAGFTDPGHESCFADIAADTTRYVVVTMDQPGFSHVMTVSNDFSTPTIGVTNASGP